MGYIFIGSLSNNPLENTAKNSIALGEPKQLSTMNALFLLFLEIQQY